MALVLSRIVVAASSRAHGLRCRSRGSRPAFRPFQHLAREDEHSARLDAEQAPSLKSARVAVDFSALPNWARSERESNAAEDWAPSPALGRLGDAEGTSSRMARSRTMGISSVTRVRARVKRSRPYRSKYERDPRACWISYRRMSSNLMSRRYRWPAASYEGCLTSVDAAGRRKRAGPYRAEARAAS